MKAQFSSLSLLLLILLQLGVEKSDASDIKSQTFDTSLYHLSSASDSVCNRASRTGLNRRLPATTMLEVVHKHGPCARDYEKQSKLSFSKILDNDKLRVQSIQARVAPSINTNKLGRDEKAKIPDGSGMPLDTRNYIVTIGLGTPKKNLTLVFDTGSDLTWTQCQPCTKHCYRQKDLIFDPRKSTSYSNISCASKHCPQNTFSCYKNVTCVYGVEYGDQSYTIGFLSKDNLAATPTDVIPHFLFGCGQNNTGLFGKTDGILGLGKGPLSFVSQTAKKYGKYFSYCLPSTIHSSGFLAFGKDNKATKKGDDHVISTPFVSAPQDIPPIFYFIEITGISVGGTRLAISGSVFKTSNTIIDSGTVITRLPMAAYKAMRKEFKKQMKYKRAPAYSLLDTCFYISGKQIKVPTVSFTFKGNATVDLDASGTLVALTSTYVCLAFAGNSNPSDMSIFGNIQQNKFEVSYDVAGGKLGFIRNPSCQ